MKEAVLFVVAGALSLLVVFGARLLERLPLSNSVVYLATGVLLGASGLVSLGPVRDATVVEHLAEVAVIVSLFTVGLKWRNPLRSAGEWPAPVRLATVGMALTIGAVALVGHSLLGLPLGATVLLGAVLAPTDPVLASEVQVRDPTDQRRRPPRPKRRGRPQRRPRLSVRDAGPGPARPAPER